MMTYGIKECGTAAVTYSEQGDLIIKLYESLNDNLTASGTTALLGNLP